MAFYASIPCVDPLDLTWNADPKQLIWLKFLCWEAIDSSKLSHETGHLRVNEADRVFCRGWRT